MDYKKDYYKILQVDKNASSYEIKKAFYKLAKQYHPDVNKNNSQAEMKFKEINEAYSILHDEKLRKEYDSYYFRYKNQFNNYFYDFYNNTKYEQTYTNKKQTKTRSSSTRTSKKKKEPKIKVNKDIKLEVQISYSELYFNKTKTIQYLQMFYDKFNKTWYQKLKNITFQIPFDYKETLIFEEKGNQSNRGLMKFGKLFINFKLKDSDIFYIDTNGLLHQKLIIDMLLAINGGEVNFLTIKKEFKKIIIPSNTSNESKIILKNYGLYNPSLKIRDNLIIDIVYDKLDYFNKQEIDVLKSLSKIHNPNKALMQYYYKLNNELEEN